MQTAGLAYFSLFFLETNRLLHVKKKRGFYMNRNAGDEQYDEPGMDWHSGMNILLLLHTKTDVSFRALGTLVYSFLPLIERCQLAIVFPPESSCSP
jgi:hypothetical protein